MSDGLGAWGSGSNLFRTSDDISGSSIQTLRHAIDTEKSRTNKANLIFLPFGFESHVISSSSM
jgi:hypothetical protein